MWYNISVTRVEVTNVALTYFNIDSCNGTQLTIESARETSSLTAQQPGRNTVKVLKLV